MRFNQSTTAFLALAGVIFGSAAMTWGQRGPNADDLLDPSLDRPIPQYRSTGTPAIEPLKKSASAIRSLPPIASEPTQPRTSDPEPVASAGPSDGSVQLAPNPLANPDSPKLAPSKEVVETRPQTRSQPTTQPRDPGTLSTPAKPLEMKTPFQPSKPKAPVKKSLSTRPKSNTKSSKSKAGSSSKKKKKEYVPKQPVLNFDIYRDQSVYPLDPRKPNNPCTQPPGCQCGSCCASGKMGIHGRPYQPKEPGGYQCGKHCPNKHPQFSVYWPRPFSAKCEERKDGCSACGGHCRCKHRKLNDMFDGLANFRLIDYHRTDNGYCGPESDPYGCLGESKVSGIGFRSPGAPVAPASAYPLQ